MISEFGLWRARPLEYKSWCSMRDRCSNPNLKCFKNYGGRGVQVCARWLGKDGFANFLADLGARPSLGHSLDRIDNNGNYEPSNCRWVTFQEQQKNRRDTRILSYQGLSLCVRDWERRLGLRKGTICTRLHRGWPVNDDLFAPPMDSGSWQSKRNAQRGVRRNGELRCQ